MTEQKIEEIDELKMEMALEAENPSVDEEIATSPEPKHEERPNLNHKNLLNVLFFVMNAVFTYGVGTSGWFGSSPNIELSEKYQTLVTPKSSAFSIWGVIFTFQAIFSIAQLFPRFRGLPMIQSGVSYWWISACVMQIGWTFSFAYEQIPLSLAFMLALWISLMGLLYCQYYTKSDGSLMEFWLFRFPFAIHGAWITAASALNVSTVSVWRFDPAATQLALAIVSLAVLHAISVWVLFVLQRPNYTIACVLCWANGWIYAELREPKDLLLTTFGETIIASVAYAARTVAFIILAEVIIRVSMCGCQTYISKALKPRSSTSE